MYEDKGFEGHQEPALLILRPKRKPKGKELDQADHTRNQEISMVRVNVEHSIRGVKIFRIAKDVYRNHKEKFDDQSMLFCCGLYHHRLLGQRVEAA